MKKFFKIVLYILFYLFIFLSIFTFVFIHSPYSKQRLKDYLAKKVEEKTGLLLDIESVHGSLVNNIRFTDLHLKNDKNISYVRIKEVEVGYNLFSIFSDSPEINSIYVNRVRVDSIPKFKKSTGPSTFYLKLPEIYISDLQYKSRVRNIASNFIYGEAYLSSEESSLKIDTANVNIKDIDETFDISSLELRVRNDTMKINHTRVSNRATTIDLNGYYNFNRERGTFKLENKNIVPQERIPEFSKLFDKDDYLNVTALTRIRGDSINAELNFSGEIRNRELKEGNAKIEMVENNIAVPDMRFATGEEEFTGNIQGGIGKGFTGELQIQNLNLKKWQFIGNPTSLSGIVKLSQKEAGKGIGIRVDLREGSIQKLDFDRITGSMDLVNDEFQITDTISLVIDKSEIEVAGSYNIPNKTMDMRGSLYSSNLEFFSPFTKIDSLSGELRGEFKIEGNLGSPNLYCQFVGNQLVTKNIFVNRVSIDLWLKEITKSNRGQIYITGDNSKVKGFNAEIDQFESQVELSKDTAYIRTVQVEGQDFVARGQGTLHNLSDLKVENINLKTKNTEIYNKTPFHVVKSKDTIVISPTNFIFGEDNFAFSGKFVKGKPRDLLLSFENISLAPLHNLNNKLPESGEINGTVKYQRIKNPEIDIDLTTKNLIYKDMNFPLADVVTSISKDTTKIEKANFFIEENSSLQMSGEILCNFPFDADQKFITGDKNLNLNVNFDNFPAEYINRYVLKQHDLEGDITGNIALNNTLETPIVNTIFKIEKPRFNRITGEYLRARASYKNDSLVLEEFNLDEGNGQYNGRGFIPLRIDFYNSQFTMLPDIEMDLEFSAMTRTLPFISAPPNNNVEKIPGDFFISLDISGTKDNPVKDGYFVADNAKINLTPLENSITNIDAQGTMRDNILHIDRFNAKMVKSEAPEVSRAKSRIRQLMNYIFVQTEKKNNEKNLVVIGNINLASFIRPQYDINLKGQDLYFRTLLAEMEGYVNGDVRIKGQDTVDMSGEIEVSKMFMRKSFNKSEQNITHNTRGPYTRFNIHTIIPGNFYISNDQMDCELSGDLWVIREGDQPWRFSGDLTILEGSFYYFGWEFTNLSGNIYFDPVKMNPRLDIHSELNLTSFGTGTSQEVSDDEDIVDVYLSGDLEKPDLHFGSENYSQNDILSLIQGSERQKNGQASSIPGSALNVFGQYFERQLERRFSQLSGIDRISFRTNDNLLQNRNLDNWKVTLGQRITPNIFVTYEHGSVYSIPTQRVEVEYRFDKNHSIEGNVDQDGLFGINYKIRYNY
ncbi:MAG: translocation/assembly module TamB domain-containing protein [Candidatus Marinimicrobia bacterium]|nr:translocation/assembly module TamB domain-containing protein [Candidatus Neomarinimicrobiota bacterium]